MAHKKSISFITDSCSYVQKVNRPLFSVHRLKPKAYWNTTDGQWDPYIDILFSTFNEMVSLNITKQNIYEKRIITKRE